MINRLNDGLPETRMPTALLWGFVVVIGMLFPSQLYSQEIESGSGKRQFRVQALQSIPFQQLNQATRNKLDVILRKPSIYRRLPITTINSDPDYFRFLVRYPEVVVDIWQLMGVTKMSSQRTGPFTIQTDDGVGTISSLELVYGSDNLHIFYGKGSYEGPVFRKKLYGSCVIILHSNFAKGAEGKPIVTNQLDVFLKVENAALGLIAKTIHPIVGATADHNFVESLRFVQRLNETTERNGPGVQRLASRLDIDRDVRDKFVDAAAVVYERSLKPKSVSGYLRPNVPTSLPRQRPNPQPIPRRRQNQVQGLPQYGSSYQPIPSESRTMRPLSSLNQLVPISGQPNLISQASYAPDNCQRCSGQSGAYAGPANSGTVRAYGYQAPNYVPVYQGQGINQPPVAYQTEAFGAQPYATGAVDWR